MPLRHWIASFSDLAGLVIIQEPRGNRIGRVRRELRRGGLLGFADVLAFRAYYSLRLSRADRNWEEDAGARLARGLPVVPCSIPRFVTDDPNNRATRRFIDDQEPDLMIARCRVLLASEIFSIPPLGTFVMHPVTTPELTWLFLGTEQPGSRACRPYALADRRGVDTGPVFGYFTHPYDERHESHEVIQKRMILENLDALRERFLAIERGEARATHPAAHQPRGVNQADEAPIGTRSM